MLAFPKPTVATLHNSPAQSYTCRDQPTRQTVTRRHAPTRQNATRRHSTNRRLTTPRLTTPRLTVPPTIRPLVTHYAATYHTVTCQDSSLRYSPNRRLITPRLITLRLITCRLCLTSRNCTSPPVPTGRPRTQRDAYPYPPPTDITPPNRTERARYRTARQSASRHDSASQLDAPTHDAAPQNYTTPRYMAGRVGTYRLHSSPHYTTRVLL